MSERKKAGLYASAKRRKRGPKKKRPVDDPGKDTNIPNECYTNDGDEVTEITTTEAPATGNNSDEPVSMTISLHSAYRSGQKTFDVRCDNTIGTNPDDTLRREDCVLGPIVAEATKIGSNVSSSLCSSQCSSLGSWILRSGLTEADLLIDSDESNAQPGEDQRTPHRESTEKISEDIQPMDVDDNTDGELTSIPDGIIPTFSVDDERLTNVTSSGTTGIGTDNREEQPIDQEAVATAEGSECRAHPFSHPRICVPCPEWLNRNSALTTTIGFTQVQHTVEITEENGQENGALSSNRVPAVDTVGQDLTSKNSGSLHSQDRSDSIATVESDRGVLVTERTGLPCAYHDYSRMASMSSSQSCTQHSTSTHSDGLWATNVDLTEECLAMDFEEEIENRSLVSGAGESHHQQTLADRPTRTEPERDDESNEDGCMSGARSESHLSPTMNFDTQNVDRMDTTAAEASVRVNPPVGEPDEVHNQALQFLGQTSENHQEQLVPTLHGNDINHQQQREENERCLSNENDSQNSASDSNRNSRITKARKKSSDFDPEVRSIVKFNHILKQLRDQFKSNLHSPYDCGIEDQELIGVVYDGFRTKFIMRCQMCQLKTDVWSELPADDHLDIDRAVVVATHSIGKGHAALEEWTANLSMYCPCYKTYQKISVEIDETFVETAKEQMKLNGVEVSSIARQQGRIIDGIPTCPIVVDGSWSVRSYGNKSRSDSGMAVGICPWTKKILFADYRNRYCYVCTRITNGTLPPHEHTCYKNWETDRSILPVESDIIVQSFKNSREEHGLMYTEMIGDGDSAVHAKVLQANPYDDITPVSKIDCRLHLQRARIGEYRRVVVAFKCGRSTEAQALKTTAFQSSRRICVDITSATRHWKNEEIESNAKIINLKKDIMNVIDHVFGNHINCAQYFCDGQGKPGEVNLVPSLQRHGLYEPLKEVFRKWSQKASDLLEDQTSNYAESFNAVLAKYDYHKGVNVQFRGVYRARIAMAVIQFSNQAIGSTFHRKLGKKPPEVLTNMEQRRQAKNDFNKKYRKKKKFAQLALGETDLMDKSPDYGKNPETPDMPLDDYAEAVRAHLTTLEQWHDNRAQIERDTRDDPALLSLKQRRILCSDHFGQICRMRQQTPTATIVAKILYPSIQKRAILEHQRYVTDRIVAEMQGFMKCGLFIHPEVKFLGAKPHGLLPNGDLIIIHCPFNIRDKTIKDAMSTDKLGLQKILKLDGKDNDGNDSIKLNQSHQLYYEIIGSLAVAEKKCCRVVIATARDSISIDVECNKQFFEETMVPKLRSFYEEFMIPEIVDSRRMRNMNLRDEKRTKKTSVSKTTAGRHLDCGDEAPENAGDEEEENCHNFLPRSERHSSIPSGTLAGTGEDMESFPNTPQSDGIINQFENRSIIEGLIAAELGDREFDIVRGNTELESDHFDVLWEIIGESTEGLYEFRPLLLIQHSLDLVEPIRPGQKHIQILNRGGNHWVCAYYDTKRIYIYDSLPPEGGCSVQPYYRILKRLFPHYSFDESPVMFPPVQKQRGSTDCGVFAAAFAVSLIYSLDPAAISYDQDQMRPHLLMIYRTKLLLHFPLASNCNITIPDLGRNVENEWNALFGPNAVSECDDLT